MGLWREGGEEEGEGSFYFLVRMVKGAMGRGDE